MSVGNLAMGGRGKTPVVARIAQWLVEAGERPAILSRGYRRVAPDDGVVIVSDGRDRRADLERSGDEPLMLARQVPGAAVLVCEIRTMAAALAESALGCTVMLLDDGFQHAAMARDVDIVLVTSEDLSDHRMPFGRLRSHVADLARAHAVVIEGTLTERAASVLASVTSPQRTTLFSLTRRLGAAVLLEHPHVEIAPGQPVVAVAGIARPSRLTTSLEAAGWQVARTMGFGDHHPYDRSDLEQMARAIRETGAVSIVTTEKDAVRLLPLRPLGLPIAAVAMSVDLRRLETRGSGREEDQYGGDFRDWLLDRVRGVRR